MEAKHYGRLALMSVLHFGAMFVLMYAMVDVVGNALPNVNQVYMAALMTAPMLVFELLLMGSMYPVKRLNLAIVAFGLVLLGGAWVAIRQQTAVADAQFLRSMVPHHAGAILMCRRAPIEDADIRALCREIASGQQAEINWMRAKLASLETGGPAPPPLPAAR